MNWALPILAILTLGISSCKPYKEVEVHGVVDLQIIEIGADGIDLNVMLDIENPNWYKIHMTESDIQVFLDGKSTGQVSLLEKMTVPKNSRSVQAMSIHTSLGDLEMLLGDIFTLLFKQEFEVTGTGFVKGRVFFVARKVPVTFTHKVTREDLGF